MLTIQKLAHNAEHAEAVLVLTLPYDLRQKSRLKTQLDDGQTAHLLLPRGRILRGGDLLQADSGELIKVCAANETVSTVKNTDNLLLSRICYHLGNRHVPLQITEHWCRYQHDHVLDDMVKQLGGELIVEQAKFEPESGAYHSHHSHQHAHSHA